MANPEYEAKVNPADLYNDEILEQFEAIRNVIHKEILPSTYNELIVTSNQAGVFNNWYNFNYYPSTELIFPLSPQSGNINWLEKNFLRFKLIVKDSNSVGHRLLDFPIVFPLPNSGSNNKSNFDLYNYTELGIIDGASIFRSIELNYGGTAIWTSAYQEVEAFFTFANIPDQLTRSSPQYFTQNKTSLDVIQSYRSTSSKIKYSGSSFSGTDSSGTSLGSPTTDVEYTILVDIDVSRISPILSWLSIIPGFINKLTLRVVLDSPSNYLIMKYSGYTFNHLGMNASTGTVTGYVNYSFNCQTPSISGYRAIPTQELSTKPWMQDVTANLYTTDKIKWKMELCEIHQCNATMTEDTRIRLISLIQQMGGKWIYPCRYWNTTIAPIQQYPDGQNTTSLQFILTGCYFRSISFTSIITYDTQNVFNTPGNGLFCLPNIQTIKIFCDSELIATYNSIEEVITDTDSALIDNDKYSISRDIIKSLMENGYSTSPSQRDCINKALGPPNGLFSGKYTSEKMGTHNIVVQLTFLNDYSTNITLQSWLGALIDGVVVFDGFNGNYFTTGRKMQQVYEALS